MVLPSGEWVTALATRLSRARETSWASTWATTGLTGGTTDADPLALGEDPGRGEGVGDEVAQVDLGAVELHALRLQPGERQQLADHRRHAVGLAADAGGVVQLRRGHPVLHGLGHRPDAGQGGAQVVREPRDELAPVGLDTSVALELGSGLGRCASALLHLAGDEPAEERGDRQAGADDDDDDLPVVVADEHRPGGDRRADGDAEQSTTSGARAAARARDRLEVQRTSRAPTSPTTTDVSSRDRGGLGDHDAPSQR